MRLMEQSMRPIARQKINHRKRSFVLKKVLGVIFFKVKNSYQCWLKLWNPVPKVLSQRAVPLSYLHYLR